MKFSEFIEAYNTGAVLEDAGWRAYDIEAMVNSVTVLKALKALSYQGSLPLAVARVAANYQIDTPARAKFLLELWQTWREIADGTRTRKLIPRKGNDND